MRLSPRLPPRSPWRGLTIQLLIVLILPLAAALLVVAFGSLALHHHAMRSLVGSRDLRAARAAASATNKQVENRLALLETLAFQAGQPADLDALLLTSPYPENFEGGLAIFSARGDLLAASGGIDWSSPDWQELSAEFHPGPESLPVILAGSPGGEQVLAAAGGPGGLVAAGAFDPARLAAQVLDDLFVDEGLAALLLDNQGRVIYRAQHSGQVTEPLLQGAAAALGGEAGILYRGSGAEELVIAYAPVPAAGWALVIQEPWQATASPLLRTTQLAPLVLVPVLLLALLALAFNARQIIQPLRALSAQAEDLSRGNYAAIEKPVGGVAEIQNLQEELARMSQRVQAAQESLHSYIGAITTSQEEERRRLARELHDDTLQALIALNQRVQLARLALEDDPAASSLDEIQDLTQQTIQNLRRLTRALRPIYLEDLGLRTSLKILAQESGRTMGLPVEFQVSGEERRLEAESELSFYRMAQEALSNVARHAGAQRVSLHLGFTPEATTLTIRDDGCGFRVPESPATFARSGHFGLLGLHERAELIGAGLSIQSAPGSGTRVVVQLPTRTASKIE